VKGGGKYVFVADGTIYQIANQNHVDLAKGAGNWVSLTGDLNGTTIYGNQGRDRHGFLHGRR
jgi:hypothetical protein